MIIEELANVPLAIEFLNDQADEDLWFDLVQYLEANPGTPCISVYSYNLVAYTLLVLAQLEKTSKPVFIMRSITAEFSEPGAAETVNNLRKKLEAKVRN